MSTCSSTPNIEEDHGFPCDKCEKSLPNQKKAKDLHMLAVHNIKTYNTTPGPVRQSTTIKRCEAGVEIHTKTSIKCCLWFCMQKWAQYEKSILKCSTIMIQPKICQKKRRCRGVFIPAKAVIQLCFPRFPIWE